jgi:hypothetical protein
VFPDRKQLVSIQSWVQFFTKRKEKMKEKKSVILFYDLLYAIDALDDYDAGSVIKAIIEYEVHGLDSEFTNNDRLNSILNMAKYQLDRGREIFEERFGKTDGRK